MLTVQEIQAMSFEKAVFGGYDMKSVDEFVEQITETIATLQKENAALKSKMKVLVDKIEEYRSVEDGMRRALVSAQNIAQETLEKSKTEAEQLLTTARTEAETRIENYRIQIANESKRLEEAKAKNAEFVAQLSAVYEEQLKSLVALSASDILVEQNAGAYPTEPINMNTEPINIDEQNYVDPKYDDNYAQNNDNYDKAEEKLEDTQRFTEQDRKKLVKNAKKDGRFKIMEVPLASSEQAEK